MNSISFSAFPRTLDFLIRFAFTSPIPGIFVNALNGDADWNKDGELTAYELKGYLSIAIDNLSTGKQNPVISLDGDDFKICADSGSTYVFAVGVDLLSNGNTSQEFAARNAEAVRQAVEGEKIETF